jgi:hypothetical protein
MNRFLKQRLPVLWKRALHDNRFEEIVGHEDFKQIFVKAILSMKKPVPPFKALGILNPHGAN